jgi:hypothetical protein
MSWLLLILKFLFDYITDTCDTWVCLSQIHFVHISYINSCLRGKPCLGIPIETQRQKLTFLLTVARNYETRKPTSFEISILVYGV